MCGHLEAPGDTRHLMPQCPECRHDVKVLGPEGFCLRCEALPMTQVCAWCKQTIKYLGPVKSHGICSPCADKLTEETA